MQYNPAHTTGTNFLSLLSECITGRLKLHLTLRIYLEKIFLWKSVFSQNFVHMVTFNMIANWPTPTCYLRTYIFICLSQPEGEGRRGWRVIRPGGKRICTEPNGQGTACLPVTCDSEQEWQKCLVKYLDFRQAHQALGGYKRIQGSWGCIEVMQVMHIVGCVLWGERKGQMQPRNGRELVANNYSEKDREQEWAFGHNGRHGGGMRPDGDLSAGAMLYRWGQVWDYAAGDWQQQWQQGLWSYKFHVNNAKDDWMQKMKRKIRSLMLKWVPWLKEWGFKGANHSNARF